MDNSELSHIEQNYERLSSIDFFQNTQGANSHNSMQRSQEKIKEVEKLAD